MGAQQTRTRRISLDNEEQVNVIKVSDDVVERLRARSSANVNEVRQNPPPDAIHTTAGQPPPFYHHEPSLTSLQIRQEAVDSLKKNDDYWGRRFEELENRHDKMREKMEEEFQRAIEDMEVRKLKTKSNCEAPCKKIGKEVLACYKKNPTEPMKCAKEVQAFAKCVDIKRVQAVEQIRCPVEAS